MTYRGDSFFTLSSGGQVGLVCLSLALLVIMIAIAARLMRGRGIVMRIALAVGLFAAFVWLSPQVYYAYYRMIIDGLPAQWVIGAPPFAQMFGYATFTAGQSLSAHGQGALLWVLVGLSLKGSGPRDPHP